MWKKKIFRGVKMGMGCGKGTIRSKECASRVGGGGGGPIGFI
jgi:hypothetical protein